METCLQIFKLKFECNQSNRTIAAALRVSPSTVYEVLSRFTAASLSWPLPDALLPEKLEKMLFVVAHCSGQLILATALDCM
ncbi:hypothetical protein ACWWJF_27255 [Symbiopectobacterium sp. Eva_TO]